MPEEKKEKKASSFFTPKGDKKKDSFTFSDKIKDSKAAASKSFANRISSKIGKDGKPKQTIFERTKRDAPFLIAALVALLLLPFLYKFSGSVSEEPLITPGSEYSDFDPNRRDAFGFDMAGDPEGQISQLSGRDSLSLIKGWGSDEDENVDESALYAGDYSGSYEGSSDAARAAASDTNVDIEENTTNIYKKRAKAGTRAAFRRATKINGLPPATRTRGSGDKLAVGNWGGRMKDAARKVQADGPRNSPKPVSLQPLQAAAKPTRTAFGDTAAAQRQSKDALGKADAKQAILDAMVKPVEPGKFGGLTSADSSSGGGGSDFKREFNYNGKEPWWWDMMKTRSQKLWERYWQRKWKWEDWLDDIKMHILGGIINCLVTGHDEGDMGSMFGTGEGGKSAKCCGQKESAFFLNYPQYKGVAFQAACDAFKKSKDGKELCKNGAWEGGTPKTRRGIIGARLACLGVMGSKYAGVDTSLDLTGAGAECETFVSAHEYTVVPQGKAKNWHIYHYVAARNYVPEAMRKAGFNAKYLCTEDSDILSMGGKYSQGSTEDYISRYTKVAASSDESWAQYLIRVHNITDDKVKKELNNKQSALDVIAKDTTLVNQMSEKKQALINEMGALASNGRKYADAKQGLLTDMYELNPEEVNNSCVVYLVQGNQFEYGNFQKMVTEGLQKLIVERTSLSPDAASAVAKEAFGQMDFFFIESVAMKKKLGYAKWGKSGNDLPLPMLYNRFFNAYVYKQGVTANEGSRRDVNERKFRDEGDYVTGRRCDFDMDVHLECIDSSVPPTATIKKGNLSSATISDIAVTAAFNPADANGGVGAFSSNLAPVKQSDPAKTYVRVFNTLSERIPEGKTAAGQVKWTINYQRNGQPFSQTKTCVVDMIPEPAPRTVTICTDGEKRTGPDGCEEICKENSWRKVDPTCYGTGDPSKVRFYPKFSVMPSVGKVLTDATPQDRPALDKNTLEKQWPSCLIDDLSTVLLEVYDDETHAYMEQAVAKYTASAQTQKEMVGYVDQTGKRPTIAQVVDAMRISKEVGIQDVPKNTVCAVARTIGHISRDPHAGHKDGKNRKYDNTFGAFAAYINYDSSFYPTMRLTDTSNGNNIEIDMRFHGCWDQKRTNQVVDSEIGGKMHEYAENGNNAKDVGSKRCGGTNNRYPNSDKECSSFHYGHYNWNHYTQGDLASKPCAGDPTGKACLQNDRKPYEAILDASIWGASGAKFPLAALAKPAFKTQWGKNLQSYYRNGTIDSYNRTQYHKVYDSVFHQGEGVSCGYAANETMKVDDALRYIDSLCANGIQRKPGNGGQINCDHYYLADHEKTISK